MGRESSAWASQGADLPDSLDSALPVSAEKVDDLLAQMAGEEIDRLLSDAENPRESTEQRATPVSPEQPVVRQLDALFAAPEVPAELPKPTRSAPPAAESKPVPAAPSDAPMGDDEVSKQLNDLFSDAETSAEVPKADAVATSAPATAPAPASPASAAPTSTEAASDAAAAVDPSLAMEMSTTSEERAALGATESDASTQDPLNLQLPEGDDEGQGLAEVAIKPLEWMNTPWGGVPDQWRDMVGKIALLTLFNALAVLVYVFLFRHHH